MSKRSLLHSRAEATGAGRRIESGSRRIPIGGQPWLVIDPRWNSSAWWILVLTVVLTGIVVVPAGKDAFRVPKETIFLSGTALACALTTVAFALGRARFVSRPHPLVWLCLAGIAWTSFSTLTSTNALLSFRSLWWIICAATFFILAWQLSIGRRAGFALAVLIPAFVNAIVTIAQSLGVELLPVEVTADHVMIGLLGNPSDVGSYLAIAFAPAVALFGRSKPWLAAGSCLLLGIAIIQSRSVTATLTVIIVALVALGVRRPKTIALLVLIVLAVGIGFVATNPNMLPNPQQFVSEGHLDELLNYRIGSTLVSLQMFFSNPLTGIGPGTYGFNFMPTAIAVLQNRSAYFDLFGMNFGEAHSDHLEVLAETGLPGYAICMAIAVVLLVMGARRLPQTRGLLLVSVTAISLVLALTQFPFQLAATSSATLFLMGLALGDEDDTRDA